MHVPVSLLLSWCVSGAHGRDADRLDGSKKGDKNWARGARQAQHRAAFAGVAEYLSACERAPDTKSAGGDISRRAN